MTETYKNTFFTTVTHEMAYILGFFAADGCMSSHNGHRRVDFESKDLDILNNILYHTGYQYIKKPVSYTKGNTFVINFTNNGWYEQLHDWGFTERKSKTVKIPPALPDEYISSFIRGFFDGDGHITKLNKRSLHQAGFTTASVDLKNQLVDIITKVVGDVTVIDKSSVDSTFQIIVSGKEKLRKLFEWLYFYSTPTTRMERKYLIFSERKYMDCYIIPPLSALPLMHKGHRYFCLAHFYLQYPEYKQFFLDIRQHPNSFITLDNSAAERSLVTETDLLSIVAELLPDEVIAPDILFDYVKTKESLDQFIDKMSDRSLLGRTKIFGCPQGHTKEEWLSCYQYMVNHPHVSTIGLSKISVPRCFSGTVTDDVEIKESRHICISELDKLDLIKKPIHFLGMGDPTEYEEYNHILLRSTDSCYTVLAAKHGIEFKSGNFTRIPTTNDFYEQPLTWPQKKLAHQNIYFLKSVLRPQYYNRDKI